MTEPANLNDPAAASDHRTPREIAPLAPQNCFKSIVPDYALLFFDHLYSEYLTLRSRIEDEQLLALLEEIHGKREEGQLSWSDIYAFDLALVDARPLENLIRKAYDARAKYRSIAGQKEYDEYLASKPPDLTTILISPNNAALKPEAEEPSIAEPSAATASPNTEPATGGENQRPDSENFKSFRLLQRVLRADIKYLLSKFYLYYAMLPMRENLREELTEKAVYLTKIILGLIVSLIILSFAGLKALEKLFGYHSISGALGLTVASVAFAGIVGGCVSMLQRIQSAPSEGDALFNLASLKNGWRGLSLSPLYGGIFASLLFVLFAAGVLEGAVFPKINTPGKSLPAETRSKTAAASSPTTATAPAATETEKTGILQITEFLKDTGPTDGVSFALLIIWSFIAGFAERLVPDTLNRLVAKNEAIQGTNG